MDCEEAYAGRHVFLSWLLNGGFPCDSHALRWGRAKIGEHGEIDLWDIARRELEKAYASHEPDQPAAHARGASAVASSWIAGLIRLSGIEVEIPDRNTDDADWLLHSVDDEFRAESHTIARTSGGFRRGHRRNAITRTYVQGGRRIYRRSRRRAKKDIHPHRSPTWWECPGAPPHRREAGHL